MIEVSVRGEKSATIGYGFGYGWGFLAMRGPKWWSGLGSLRGFRGVIGCPASHLIGSKQT